MFQQDFVQLATVIEKRYNYAEYISPVIMGYSSGATLVYGILAQSRPGTFKGGISLGFCPDIELPKMLCQINGLTEKVDIEGKRYFHFPTQSSEADGSSSMVNLIKFVIIMRLPILSKKPLMRN